VPDTDDDKTPPPTRNPFASEATPSPAEPSVQVSADLMADELETQGRGIPPPRPALRPAATPPARPTGTRPAVASPPPARRPAPPAPARPPPPVDDLGDDDDAPRELDSSEKTHIKPMPEKPRR
jgi:pilus assembly protein CpaF